MPPLFKNARRKLWRRLPMSGRLSKSKIEAILRGGRIGGKEPFTHWLNRANQIPMDDAPSRMAEYLSKIGIKSLRWKQAGTWRRDERVSVTYLIANLVEHHAHVGNELSYTSHCYDWKSKYEYSHTRGKWESEIWIEYHSAPSEYRPIMLKLLEDAKIGEITYPIWLHLIAASTHVGVLATLLTANGIFDIRTEPDSSSGANLWSSYLVVSLPPSELSTNPNMPPVELADFVASMLRNPHTHFLMRTEVWVPLQVELPLDPSTERRIREFQDRGKWWR